MTKPILLVEDNPDDEQLTIMALKENNIANQVVVARDGAEAIDFLTPGNVNHIIPSIILLDLKLPKLNGLEVLRRLREVEETKLLPVVVMTSSKEEKDILGSYALGANSYITKPVDFEQFVAAVQQLGLYWLVLNQHPYMERLKG